MATSGSNDSRAALEPEGLKRFRRSSRNRKELLLSARKTLSEEAAFDTRICRTRSTSLRRVHPEHVFRLRDREKFLLKKNRRRPGRIENSTFGSARICEEEISVKRLERAGDDHCIRCKEEQEKQEKSYG